MLSNEDENPIDNHMIKDYTKTDRVLLLIQLICKAPLLTLSEKKVKDILGNPSKAQYHKLINELIADVGQRKAILLKLKDDEGNINFQLNQCDWVQYIEGTQEIQFILKSYKEMGHLFPKIDVDGMSVNSKLLDRKFHYLSQIRVKAEPKDMNSNLELVIKALVGSRRLFIHYADSHSPIQIFPLTLVQYRDDLYLMAYKDEIGEDHIRTYKISRIKKIIESTDKFKYPIEAKWNPKERFINCSGIFTGNEKKARFRVFNESKKILSEKNFFNSKIIESNKDFDEYECVYSNIEELMGFLFIYGQDVEIVGDAGLKKAFKDKAEKILKRNQ